MTTLTTEVENKLIVRAQQGDREAFGELVCQNQTAVIAVVYRMCGDARLAEDAAQEAFIQAWLHLPGYQPRSCLRNWLYRIAINAALDVLRRERGTQEIDEDVFLIEDPRPGPEVELLQKEKAQIVQHAILALSETNRAVLVLREYGGLNYREIAAALGIPLGTVMSRLNYARERLRSSLKPLLSNLEIKHG